MVLYPILYRYISFIPMITVAELIMTIIVGVIIWTKKMKFKIDKYLLPFWIYIIVRSFGSIMSKSSNISDAIGTGLRLLLLYFFISQASSFMDYKRGRRYIDAVSIMVGVYGLLQIVVYNWGVILPTEIPGFTHRDAYNEMLTLQGLGLELRIRSIFGEPSELCHYLLLPLTLALFSNDNLRRKIKLTIFYSLVCIISLSSTAIVMVAFIWCIYIFDSRFGKVKEKLFIFCVGIAGVVTVVQFGAWDYFLYRLFGNSGIHNATRFKSIQNLFSNGFGITDFIIGKGMADPGEFLPGFARLFYCLGIIGVLTYVFFLYGCYRKAKADQRKVLIVFIVLNFAAAILFGEFALLYLSFITANISSARVNKLQPV